MKQQKTNAIRIIEQKEIAYMAYEYPHEEGVFVDGKTVAHLLGEDPNQVFKTILLESNNKYYVSLIPVCDEIDLKKAAKAFNLKSVELAPVKNLFQITGYVRGGCSPIGMKKQFPTIIDETALLFDHIIFSGGRIGLQLELAVSDIKELIDVSFVDIRR